MNNSNTLNNKVWTDIASKTGSDESFFYFAKEETYIKWKLEQLGGHEGQNSI